MLIESFESSSYQSFFVQVLIKRLEKNFIVPDRVNENNLRTVRSMEFDRSFESRYRVFIH